MAREGLITIAIDWRNHGERAVKVDDSDRCDDKSFNDAPTCYEHIISRELAAGRDNLRQSVLDALALIRAIKSCESDAACRAILPVDTAKVGDVAKIGYVGTSLGGILGTLVAAVSPDIKAAVLNVGGAGWVSIFANSASPFIKCPIVDNLIGAGVLSGEVWAGGSNSDALCLVESWKSDPRYRAFASAAQWALDPGDPANYAGLLRDRIDADETCVLVQQVLGDGVVPNPTTEKQARLLGLGRPRADGLTDPIAASVAQVNRGRPTATSFDPCRDWVAYASTGGNRYEHASLVFQSDPREPASWYGTAQIRADAAVFLRGALP